MSQTLLSSRRHVALFGDTNAGKSTIFNLLCGQDVAIVSPQRGTTTDPIVKAMELLPYGPIALVDTAGLHDETDLGRQRMRKTRGIMNRTDLAVYVADCTDFVESGYQELRQKLQKKQAPCLLVLTKLDLISPQEAQDLQARYLEALLVAKDDAASIDRLRTAICQQLEALGDFDQGMMGGILPEKSTVVMVVPVDSEAPRGRLILPQVQVIRECLDGNIKCMVVQEEELDDAIRDLRQVDLVVTDSQSFPYVSQHVPDSVPLVSFSILKAREKGDIRRFYRGVAAVEHLPDPARILVAEVCTHNHTDVDIGRVKIPHLLRQHTGKTLHFDFCSGQDFPEDVSEYDLIIHCGGCMLTRANMVGRQDLCTRSGVPITNYGFLLAYLSGALERSAQILQDELQETSSTP